MNHSEFSGSAPAEPDLVGGSAPDGGFTQGGEQMQPKGFRAMNS